MECPKCGKTAYVLETRNQRINQGEPLTQYRRYVCSDWRCNTVFVYRSTFVEYRDVDDVVKILRTLERQGKNVSTGQEEMEFEED